MYRIVSYQTAKGEKPFWLWLETLKDKTLRARIWARLDRLILGNFGDCKPVGSGVFELRFHFASGCRVYYGFDDRILVVLLMGGDKSGQKKDIARAHEFWKNYLRRKNETVD